MSCCRNRDSGLGNKTDESILEAKQKLVQSDFLVHYDLKENCHQIQKLVERKIQGLVSSCRKPTVQTATEAENRQRVVQTILRMYTKSYSLEVTTLGLTLPSAPNAPKIQRDMIYELI